VSISELRDTNIFSGFTDDDLEYIARICRRRFHRAGEYCTIQGMTSDVLQILNDGKVAIEMRIEVAPSTQTLRVGTLTRGDIIDFSAFLEPHAPTTSAICLEKVETICIKFTDLEGLLRERASIEPKLMRNLVNIMGSRFRDSRIQLARLVVEMAKQEK
jgi:CRP-like cAMP-binding protein